MAIAVIANRVQIVFYVLHDPVPFGAAMDYYQIKGHLVQMGI